MPELSIYDRLAKAQKVIGNPSPDAEANVTSTRSYKYATLANVLDIVRPALNEQGLFLSQRVVGKRPEVFIQTSVFCGNEKCLVLDLFPLNYTPDARAFGSAVTYAKRYSLLACFAISSAEDDDDGAATQKPKAKSPKTGVDDYKRALTAAKRDRGIPIPDAIETVNETIGKPQETWSEDDYKRACDIVDSLYPALAEQDIPF